MCEDRKLDEHRDFLAGRASQAWKADQSKDMNSAIAECGNLELM